MRADRAFLEGRFRRFNDLYFAGRLPVVALRLGTARTRLGSLKYGLRRLPDGREERYGFVLTVSTAFDLPERELEDVLLHEMIHLYIHSAQLRDTSPHGTLFRQMMNMLNQRYGRHITISHRSQDGSRPHEDHRLRLHLVCVATLNDGSVGLAVCARSRIFELDDVLPRLYPVAKLEWYSTFNPYFNRFPRIVKPKLYRADKAELSKYLHSAVELERVGDVFRPRKA